MSFINELKKFLKFMRHTYSNPLDLDSKEGRLELMGPWRINPNSRKTNDRRGLTLNQSMLPGYYDLLKKARKDSLLNHVTKSELEDNLWDLFFTLFFDKDLSEFPSASKLDEIITDWYNKLSREEFEWQFYLSLNFPIVDQKVKLNQHAYLIDLTKIENDDPENQRFKENLENAKNSTIFSLNYYDDWIQRSRNPVIVLTIQANNYYSAQRRTFNQAQRNLVAVNSGYRNQTQHSGDIILEEPTMILAIPKHENFRPILTTKRNLISEDMSLKVDNQSINPDKISYLQLIEKTNKTKLDKKIIRAHDWYYDALTLNNKDLKFISGIFALETVFAQKSDPRKGEAIAFRIMLLESRIREHFKKPDVWLEWYIERSNIVHGSMRISELEPEYKIKFTQRRKEEPFHYIIDNLLYNIPILLEQVITVTREHNISRRSKLIRHLEQNDQLLVDTIGWIKSNYSHDYDLNQYLKSSYPKIWGIRNKTLFTRILNKIKSFLS